MKSSKEGERVARGLATVLFIAVVGFAIWANVHLILSPAPAHPHQPGDMRYDVFAR